MLFDLQRALWVAFFHTAERLSGSAAAAQIQDWEESMWGSKKEK
jgi:hypothetical protein